MWSRSDRWDHIIKMETIEAINKRLKDYFGLFETTDKPNYRIVFSDEQFENRLTNRSREGFILQQAEFRKMPKYSWIKSKYILEKLIPVPPQNLHELTEPLSYECIWVFEDRHGNPLPPIWSAIELILDTLHKQMTGIIKKYTDPEMEPEANNKRVDQLVEDLFGNETEISDALTYKQGIVVPSNYKEH